MHDSEPHEIETPSPSAGRAHGRLLRDPVTGVWSIVASERRDRPRHDADVPCPFCPGNEHLTPPAVDVIHTGRDDDDCGWAVRAFPNSYPALPGGHEVIVHSPDHDRDLERLDDEQVGRVLRMYCRRLDAHLGAGARAVTIVCNRDLRSGASLPHPHSQLLATPLVPSRLLDELENLARFRNRYGTCLLCEEIGRAAAEDRLVLDGDVVAWVPAAPMWPYAVWLAPSEHADDFRAADLKATAVALRRMLGAVVLASDDAPLNYWLHTVPADRGSTFHWHIEIAPRLQTIGAVELATGMTVCETGAREAAAALRAALGRSQPQADGAGGARRPAS